MANTGPGKHRHLDSRGKWTTDKDPDHVHAETPHPADVLTADQVSKLILIAAGPGGGITPEPPNVPPFPTPGPTITGPNSQNVTTTSAQIVWSVSPNANGQVEYGQTTAYGSQTTLEASYLAAHSQTISGLTPNLTYHYRVKSQAATGPISVSGDRTFSTSQTIPVPPNAGLPPEGSLRYIPWTIPPLPAKGVRYSDPSGSKGVRYTDAGHGPLYSKRNIDNANGDKLFNGYTGQIHSGTFPYAQTGNPGNYGNFCWDQSNADRGWATDNGDANGNLRQINLSNPASPSETNKWPAGENITLTAEGNISHNELVVEESLDRLGWVRVVDVTDGTATSFWSLGGVPDSVTMSKNGAYVVGVFEPSSTGHVNEIWAYNIDGTGAHRVRTTARHGDTGIDQAGHQVWVQAGAQMHRLDLTDGPQVNLLPAGNAFDQIHVSCTGLDGWALLSEMNPENNIGKLGNGQIIAVKLDGSQVVMNFGFSYSTGATGSDNQPQAAWSRDGLRVFFKRYQGGQVYGMILGLGV